jgi:hypothetical protein
VDDLDYNVKNKVPLDTVNYTENKEANINFVKKIDANTFRCATYERGVEDDIGLWNGCNCNSDSDECNGTTDATSIDLNVEAENSSFLFDKRRSIYECI